MTYVLETIAFALAWVILGYLMIKIFEGGQHVR